MQLQGRHVLRPEDQAPQAGQVDALQFALLGLAQPAGRSSQKEDQDQGGSASSQHDHVDHEQRGGVSKSEEGQDHPDEQGCQQDLPQFIVSLDLEGPHQNAPFPEG